LRAGQRPLGGRVVAQLDLGEALASDLAGILQADLADVAQAFAPLLSPYPILNDPTLAIAA
jgi:hypothetical protein